MPLTPGIRLGAYEIVAALGAGGMGEVYRARDTRLGRQVAVKVLPAESLLDDKARARLLREARLAATLNHPNICTVHEVGEAAGHVYLAMELIDGRPLSEAIAERSAGLATENVVRYGSQIAAALAHAHERHVVHRDLKSANVVVTPDGRAKVLDFGVARHVPEGPDEAARTRQVTLTETGAIVGTPHYLAPEVLRGGVADERSDLWTLGVLLHEMASGSLPFRGATSYELASAIMHDVPAALPGRVPAGLKAVIGRCLAKEPGERYERASEVRAALEALQSGASGGPARRPGPRAGAGEPEPAVSGWPAPIPSGPSPSIAVVPFAELGGGAENAFLADGLSEEIITDLSRLKDVRVISRASCFRLRGLAAAEAGREVGVRFVLEGSLRRAGQALRINAQLVDVAHGRAVWGERFDTVMGDLFAVQERMARAIVEMLRVTISPAESVGLSARPIRDAAAYECYLRARHELWQLSPAAIDRALALLHEGLARGGENVLLLATLGEVWVSAHEFGLIPDEKPLLEAERFAERAARLDRNAPASLFLSGLVHFKRGRMQQAIDALAQVLVLEPGNADAVTWMNAACFISGRVDAAAPLAARLASMDPLTPMSVAHEGFVDLYAGRLEVAEPKYRRWLERDPDNPFAHYCWGMVLAQRGRAAEAAEAFESVTRMVPNHVLDMLGTFLRHALRGDGEAARAAVRPSLEGAVRLSTYLAPHMAAGYALLGDRDRALEWLEVGFGNGFAAWGMLEGSLAWYPGLDADPRFHDLLDRMRMHSESLRV